MKFLAAVPQRSLVASRPVPGGQSNFSLACDSVLRRLTQMSHPSEVGADSAVRAHTRRQRSLSKRDAKLFQVVMERRGISPATPAPQLPSDSAPSTRSQATEASSYRLDFSSPRSARQCRSVGRSGAPTRLFLRRVASVGRSVGPDRLKIGGLHSIPVGRSTRKSSHQGFRALPSPHAPLAYKIGRHASSEGFSTSVTHRSGAAPPRWSA